MDIFIFRRFLHLSIFFFLSGQLSAQRTVFTEDIDHFWAAYDSINITKDSAQQIHFIQALYVDKGTPGLKAFMTARKYSSELYVRLINKYPKFWNSIRQHTLSVKSRIPGIEKSIAKLKTIYPGLKNAEMYFTIGGLRSGGTTKDSMVLIGAEIATGDSTTDVSEFSTRWLAGVFKGQNADNLVSLNVHEYIHTQQNGEGSNLLAQAITEGSCDFIAELVTGSELQRNYITYGRQHEHELKELFKQDMFGTAFNRWLYNGGDAKTVADLGYFMGYEICKSFYRNATDKTQAIKKIIELNYSDTLAVESFLKQSKYYREPINKNELLRSFQAKQPKLLKVEPTIGDNTLIDTSVKQLTLIFSKPMSSGISINYGEKGKLLYPIKETIGFSEDKTKFSVRVSLQPNQEYEFIITNLGFASADGYPLLTDYPVKFKTKP